MSAPAVGEPPGTFSQNSDEVPRAPASHMASSAPMDDRPLTIRLITLPRRCRDPMKRSRCAGPYPPGELRVRVPAQHNGFHDLAEFAECRQTLVVGNCHGHVLGIVALRITQRPGCVQRLLRSGVVVGMKASRAPCVSRFTSCWNSDSSDRGTMDATSRHSACALPSRMRVPPSRSSISSSPRQLASAGVPRRTYRWQRPPVRNPGISPNPAPASIRIQRGASSRRICPNRATKGCAVPSPWCGRSAMPGEHGRYARRIEIRVEHHDSVSAGGQMRRRRCECGRSSDAAFERVEQHHRGLMVRSQLPWWLGRRSKPARLRHVPSENTELLRRFMERGLLPGSILPSAVGMASILSLNHTTVRYGSSRPRP